MPIAKDPGYYAVILDVFHQLHCLNMIRKRVRSRESFDEMQDGPLNTVHMDHCLDSLRQSLMCSGDITPMPFVWYKQFEEAAECGCCRSTFERELRSSLAASVSITGGGVKKTEGSDVKEVMTKYQFVTWRYFERRGSFSSTKVRIGTV
ncbi:hypothetical protein PRZ48_012817 [Zasmidium cellare]|uniref:Uncharacterized protein n=1 Tax=Zasmidium cellare TaxID=395010 RepID=A0ABR0E5X2_ZASCE|nr:hypothetical protein PRZ48_012817 [Zasmidium cellare]